jgi:hypothetical protein
MTGNVQFEIALSFAGEDRTYVDQVANLLRDSGVKVFYDLFEESSLWGKNLYDYLSDVNQNKALYTIMFISKHYAEKLWPTHERQAMQARAFQEHQEYVLPARFDDTQIPGVLPTIGYISLTNRPPPEFVKLIHKKLVQAGRSIPSEQIRAAVYSVESLPRVDPTEATVHVIDENGDAIEGVSLTALADNNTYKDAVSDSDGRAKIVFQTRCRLRVLVAHSERPGAVISDWDPADDLRVTLPASENTGSVICHSTVHIPGLKGRLNPILDTSSRLYLYADNIAIRGGEQQPAQFQIEVPFPLEDCDGTVMQVRVVHIQGRTSLLQYVHGRHHRSDA